MTKVKSKNEEIKDKKLSRAIGVTLRICRERCNFTQERLGEVLGISFQQVQKYERGINRISFEKIIVFLQAIENPKEIFDEFFAPFFDRNDAVNHVKCIPLTDPMRQAIMIIESIDDPRTLDMVLQILLTLTSNKPASVQTVA